MLIVTIKFLKLNWNTIIKSSIRSSASFYYAPTCTKLPHDDSQRVFLLPFLTD